MDIDTSVLLFGLGIAFLAGCAGLVILAANWLLEDRPSDALSPSDGAETERSELAGRGVPDLWQAASRDRDDFEHAARALRRIKS